MTEALHGKDFIARVRLSDREDRTLAVPGQTCEAVDVASLSWLLDQELIEPVPQTSPSIVTSPEPDEES